MSLLAQCCTLSYSSLRLMISEWVGAFSSVLEKNVSTILWSDIQPFCQTLPQLKKKTKSRVTLAHIYLSCLCPILLDLTQEQGDYLLPSSNCRDGGENPRIVCSRPSTSASPSDETMN